MTLRLQPNAGEERSIEGALSKHFWFAQAALAGMLALLASTGGAASASVAPVRLAATSQWRGLPPGVFSRGSVNHTLVIDGGELVITPPAPRVHSRISQSAARGDVSGSTTATPGVVDPAGIALGVVGFAPRLSASVHAPSGRLAWVGIVEPELGASCPFAFNRTGRPIIYEPSFHVVVIWAAGGGALTYTSRGTGVCGGSIRPPLLTEATRIVSVPWRAVGGSELPTTPTRYLWRITYDEPTCAVLFDSPGIFTIGPSKPTLFVQVSVPLIIPRGCHSQKSSTTDFGPESVPVGQAGHAPLGTHQF
jgi:hypothetical protein